MIDLACVLLVWNPAKKKTWRGQSWYRENLTIQLSLSKPSLKKKLFSFLCIFMIGYLWVEYFLIKDIHVTLWQHWSFQT